MSVCVSVSVCVVYSGWMRLYHRELVCVCCCTRHMVWWDTVQCSFSQDVDKGNMAAETSVPPIVEMLNYDTQ